MGHPVCRQANLAAVSPVLESLSLDDGYRLDFSPDVQDYTVFLPVGRPRIPRIHAAAAEGTTVTVYPAALADADVEGTAYVLLCSGLVQNRNIESALSAPQNWALCCNMRINMPLPRR